MTENKKFLAIKKYKDGGESTEEYFCTREQAIKWISAQEKSGKFKWMIGEYE